MIIYASCQIAFQTRAVYLNNPSLLGSCYGVGLQVLCNRIVVERIREIVHGNWVLAHSGPSVVKDSFYYYRSRWAARSRGEPELECLNPHPETPALGCGFLPGLEKCQVCLKMHPSEAWPFMFPLEYRVGSNF